MTIRHAQGSGRWFPGKPAELKTAVEGYMAAAKLPEVAGRIVGAMAPHAGYVYSGPTAGYTFQALQANAASAGAPETVVLLGLSHRAPFRGIALMDGTAIATPLGQTPLDQAAADILVNASDCVFTDYTPHAVEHSAENEVPFLQAALPDTRLVIGLCGDHDLATVEAVTGALVELARHKRILVVASSDLLHDADYDRVRRTDHATLELIAALDHQRLWDRWDYHAQLCCGISAVCIAMRFAQAQGSQAGSVLHYCNSGDEFPENRGDWVVGYGSAVFSSKEDLS